MSRSAQILAWSTGLLIGLITLLACLLWFVFSTTTGSRLVFSQIESLSNGKLMIKQVDGSLKGPLRITGLRFQAPSVNVKLQTVELNWSLSALISQQTLQIEDLHLQGLQIEILKDEDLIEEDAALSLPDAITLPLPIRVAHFSLRDTTVRSGENPSKDRVVVQNLLATQLSWNADGIRTPQLSVLSRPLEFNGNVHLHPQASWPLTLDLNYSVDMTQNQLPNASGKLNVTGSLAQFKLLQTIQPPYSLRVDADVNDPLTAPRWQAMFTAENMQIADLSDNLPNVGLTATLQATGDLTQATLNADLKVERSSAQLEGNVNFGAALTDAPTIDLDVAWQQLIWPIDASDNYRIRSDSGSAHVTGVLDDYRANISAQLSVPAYPKGELVMNGKGSQQGFDLEQLTLSILGGEILGSATVNWQTQINATFDLSAKDIDPAGLDAKWPGRLHFITQGQATSGADGLGTQLDASLELSGVLRGKPVSAELVGAFDDHGLRIPKLVVNALGGRLTAKGTVLTASQPIDLQWQLSMTDLGFWMPGLTGDVEATGSLTGTSKDPRIQASMTASDISVAQISIGHAVMTTDLGLGAAPLSINADLQGLQLGESHIGSLAFDLSGTLARHVMGLTTKSDSGDNRLALSGSLSDLPADGTDAPLEAWGQANWQFSLDALDVNEGDIAIDLIKDNESKYIGRVDGDSITIADTCFNVSDNSQQVNKRLISDQRICAQATGSFADEFSSQITFSHLPLMILNPVLPQSMGLTGRLAGDVSLGWNMVTNKPHAIVALNTTASDLQSTNSQGDIKTLLQFEPGTLNANWRDDVLSAVIKLPLAGNAGLNATATISPAQDGELFSRPIDAQIAAQFDDLEWMADFLQGVTQLNGQLDTNLNVSGTLAGPTLEGALTLTRGRAVLPGPGLILRDLDVNIVGTGNDGLTVTGNVKSGGGNLSLQGQLSDFGSNMSGQLSLTGEKVLLLNTPEAVIYASPIIHAELKQTQLALTGDVNIHSADIQLASLPQTAATVSSDQIIELADAPNTQQQSRFEVTTRLNLLLNDAVSFRGFGLDATFGGNLSLVDLPGKPITANGDINVLQGHYRAYGQNLDIETGKLFFVGGPIDQPGIDVRAVRQVTPDIKVGAFARGTLRSPEFAIFSEPAMNQSDQLAYLVLGRPLSTSSSGESSMLSRAALAMGIKGGNYLTEQFGSRLGVDRIGIETPGSNANEQAALVVGKYLSPKLFVSYGIGILDAVSTLKIEYILSSQWRLTSESSVDQGGIDLNYVLER